MSNRVNENGRKYGNHLPPLKLELMRPIFDNTEGFINTGYSPRFISPNPRVHRNPTDEVFNSLYKLGKGLGAGAYAKVQLATHRSSGEQFAVKIIDMSKFRVEECTRVYREIDILRKVRHPNCIAMTECFFTPKSTIIVMELATAGDLFDKLISNIRFAEAEAAEYTRQILTGVEYLHSKGIVHRDIKLENLLLTKNGSETCVKLGDFGLAKCCTKSSLLSTICGSPGYVAPEVLHAELREKQNYTEAVDMWGTGVVLYTMLSGTVPFDRPDDIEKIRIGHYSIRGGVWDTVSSEAKDLVEAMLCVDPEIRVTARQALEHPWIKAYTQKNTKTPRKKEIMYKGFEYPDQVHDFGSPSSRSPNTKSPIARSPLSLSKVENKVPVMPLSPLGMPSPQFKRKENIFQPSPKGFNYQPLPRNSPSPSPRPSPHQNSLLLSHFSQINLSD